MRIPGGLVLLEKQKSVNGILVPIAHDQRAHDYVPSSFARGSTRGSAATLSHTVYLGRNHPFSLGQRLKHVDLLEMT